MSLFPITDNTKCHTVTQNYSIEPSFLLQYTCQTSFPLSPVYSLIVCLQIHTTEFLSLFYKLLSPQQSHDSYLKLLPSHFKCILLNNVKWPTNYALHCNCRITGVGVNITNCVQIPEGIRQLKKSQWQIILWTFTCCQQSLINHPSVTTNNTKFLQAEQHAARSQSLWHYVSLSSRVNPSKSWSILCLLMYFLLQMLVLSLHLHKNSVRVSQA